MSSSPLTLDDLWPLPVTYRCSACRAALLAPGPCKRRNTRGHSLCAGHAVPVTLYRARCRCFSWTVTEQQLLSRCKVCHRRIEEWDSEYLLSFLVQKERGPEGISTPRAGQAGTKPVKRRGYQKSPPQVESLL